MILLRHERVECQKPSGVPSHYGHYARDQSLPAVCLLRKLRGKSNLLLSHELGL
jgi:hypothetical protein